MNQFIFILRDLISFLSFMTSLSVNDFLLVIKGVKQESLAPSRLPRLDLAYGGMQSVPHYLLGARCLSFEKTVFIQVIWTFHVDAIIGTNKYNLLDLWKKNSQNKQRPWPSLNADALSLEYQKRGGTKLHRNFLPKVYACTSPFVEPAPCWVLFSLIFTLETL